MAKLESRFKRETCDEIEQVLLPGCIVTHGNANYIQGIPDTLILAKGWWGALEFKRASNSTLQVNQEYYVELMNEMSFASFIHPDNKEEVLDAIQQSFQSSRNARFLRR